MSKIIEVKNRKINIPHTICVPFYYFIDENDKITMDIDQIRDEFVSKLQELENQIHELNN